MGSPSKDLVEAESALRMVIENLIDAQEGMLKIGEEVKDEALKSFFLTEGLKRAQYRGELENILHQEGVRDIHESGTAAGTFVRAWTGFRAKLGGGEPGLLQAAEEAEHTMIEAYNNALANDLPAPIREVLTQQAMWVIASHDAIRAARESRV
jgi:uncharacterized protein (TIGR02284 family)